MSERIKNKKLRDPLVYIPMRKREGKIKRDWKTYRSAASCFTNRIQVKEYILKKDDYKCVICGSKGNLQMDHIVSVRRGFDECTDIRKINNIKNIQTLCRSCNLKKAI